jgi:hypothetical protein
MWLLLALLLAQSPPAKFEDFPAGPPFKGAPAKPVLKTNWQRSYRTSIRDAASQGPDFAAKYKIAQWGCGSGCIGIAIIDEQSGAVYDGPFHVVAFTPASYPDQPDKSAFDDPIQYKLQSRLFVVHGCLEDNLAACASYYYEWTGTAFRLLKKIPAALPPEPREPASGS